MSAKLRHRPVVEEEDASALKLGAGVWIVMSMSRMELTETTAHLIQNSTMPVVC